MLKTATLSSQDIFSTLADRHSVNIFKRAYSGLRATSKNHIDNLSKKQFYVRLKRLTDLGLIEKRDSFYRTTTFGSVVYNAQIKTMEDVIANYWSLKSIDVLRSRSDFPDNETESIVSELLNSANLKDVVNSTHLTGFSIVNNFDNLIVEVLKILDNAVKEVYFATRYHQPDVSTKTFEIFGKGVTLHILDGNPEQISVENRINAILRTPPNKETSDLINRIIRSPRFDLMRMPELPISFLVVDSIQVVYEAVSYTNPEQFTTAIAKYDDPYLAQQLIHYFKIISQKAFTPKLLQEARVKRTNEHEWSSLLLSR
jgi:predicted transcriptional regulator